MQLPFEVYVYSSCESVEEMPFCVEGSSDSSQEELNQEEVMVQEGVKKMERNMFSFAKNGTLMKRDNNILHELDESFS